MQDSLPMFDKRPKFGNRHLNNETDVFNHNAWDNVIWDEEFRKDVITKIDANSNEKLPTHRANELEENASVYWNSFYDKHENKFFKDRHWLFTEFSELLPSDSPKTILELGCGVGNTVFPLLELDQNKSLFVYCCDFSEKAIKLVKQNHLFDQNRCHAFTFDLTDSDWKLLPIAHNSLDIVTLIFVLSAIDPVYHKQIISNIRSYLKPSGRILFRDYGYCDLTQVRFKNGHCIKNNFYVRGDGTRAYFFDEFELDKLFTESGMSKIDLHVDRRLQINRANKKKMYRIWIQAKYQKKND